jgi:methylated-DNA-[protein]-cysteine S-methyltransferase
MSRRTKDESRTNHEIERALRDGPRDMGPGAPGGDIPEQAAAAAARLAGRILADGLADIGFGPVDSPFGVLHAATTKRGLVRLAFPEEPLDSCLEGLAARLSPRIVESPGSLDLLRRELEEYFSGRRRRFDVKLDWSLITPFARRVLRRTAAIPYGGHLSYAEVAAEAGSPRGARAAGNALGSNPIPIVIPCHRVLHSGGGLGGYGGGLDRKRFLLELEGALPPRR